MKKITMKDAKKMAKHEFILMHIEWRKDLMNEHPDCSHILIHNRNRK